MEDKISDKAGVSRRDFLELSALWSVALSALGIFLGMLRIFKPNVRYEGSMRYKIGRPVNFPVGTVKQLVDEKTFIFAEDEGFNAVSSVCTHLGCIVRKTDWGFQCPCHGSKYDQNGEVIKGPAPRPLPWYEITQSEDGSLVVDENKVVPLGTRYLFKT